MAKAVDGIDFEILGGETLGVVGESGCGKSVTALSIMRLFPSPPGRIAGGRIWFKGRELTALTGREMRAIRGCEIGMIFQEPMTSLNPVYSVGDQIVEAIRLHQDLSRSAIRETGGGDAGGGGDRLAGEAFPRVSAPDERRDASAGDDRHGPLLQPQPA